MPRFSTRRHAWRPTYPTGWRRRLLLAAGVVTLALVAWTQGAPPAAAAENPVPAWATHGIPLSAAEADWLRAHPRVRLVGDPAWPPCSFVDAQGHYHGSDLDIVRLAGRRLGLTFEEVPRHLLGRCPAETLRR